MAQLNNYFSEFQNFIPWVSLLAGLGGSLHCVGMCGGLVTASCENNSEIIRYQVGRLMGYLLLGALAGALGGAFNMGHAPSWLKLVPSLIVGSLFIFWGVRSLQGLKAELPLPRFFRVAYQQLWTKVNRQFPQVTKAFFTGLISILLPCGLLYGVIAATVAVQNPWAAMVGMLCFWLGTLPAMVVAPGLVKKVLTPLQRHRPKFYAFGLMTIGILTIGTRALKQWEISEKLPQPSASHQCH